MDKIHTCMSIFIHNGIDSRRSIWFHVFFLGFKKAVEYIKIQVFSLADKQNHISKTPLIHVWFLLPFNRYQLISILCFPSHYFQTFLSILCIFQKFFFISQFSISFSLSQTSIFFWFLIISVSMHFQLNFSLYRLIENNGSKYTCMKTCVIQYCPSIQSKANVY